MLKDHEIQRYKSQLFLREIGELGQNKICNSSALIIGAGGLGSPLALYLAAAGVGRIGIIDNDNIELSNLNRQIAYCTSDIENPKTTILKKAINDRNDSIIVEDHPYRLNEFNSDTLIKNYDVIIDGADNFETRFIAANSAFENEKPYIFGAASGFEGQIATFAPYTKDHEGLPAPYLTCFLGEGIRDENLPPCSQGVIGPAVGIIALYQAIEAIKLITNIGNNLIGWVMIFDFLHNNQKKLRLKRDPAKN